jgi:hypothetical protein
VTTIKNQPYKEETKETSRRKKNIWNEICCSSSIFGIGNLEELAS